MENHRKTKIKKKKVYEPSLGFGNQLRVGNVLTSYNVCPKTIPLIK